MDHDSDCALHNAPAMPVGACDCSVSARVAPPTHLDGTPVDEAEIAKAREIINTNGVEFAPGVEEELQKMGLSKDDVTAALLKSVGGQQ